MTRTAKSVLFRIAQPLIHRAILARTADDAVEIGLAAWAWRSLDRRSKGQGPRTGDCGHSRVPEALRRVEVSGRNGEVKMAILVSLLQCSARTMWPRWWPSSRR
jgi:hypothetical protein